MCETLLLPKVHPALLFSCPALVPEPLLPPPPTFYSVLLGSYVKAAATVPGVGWWRCLHGGGPCYFSAAFLCSSFKAILSLTVSPVPNTSFFFLK